MLKVLYTTSSLFLLALCTRDMLIVEIQYGEEDTCNVTTNFDPDELVCSNRTFFFVHGWFGGPHVEPYATITKLLAAAPNSYNSIFVNWETIAASLLYIDIDTQFVGVCLAQYIRTNIIRNCPDAFLHVIGHSLGAHVAGSTGKELQRWKLNLDVITGLDPAGPSFYTIKQRESLTPDDARQVVVLHTNSFLYGNARNLGKVNFNANGGRFQPGCGGKQLFCSHMMSVDYITAVLEHNVTRKFVAKACRMFLGIVLSESEYNLLNFDIHVPHNSSGVYCFDTNNNPPYQMGRTPPRSNVGSTEHVTQLAANEFRNSMFRWMRTYRGDFRRAYRQFINITVN